MRRHGDPAAVGGDGEGEDAAELSRGEPARSGTRGETGGGGELQGVVALGVRHPHHPLLAVRAEGAGQPGADAGGGGEHAGGARAVGDPVDGAAYGDRAAARGVVGGRGPEPAGGGDRVGLLVGALAAEADVEAARFGAVQVVQDPEFTGGGVDDPGAVTGRVPGVEASPTLGFARPGGAPKRGVAAEVGAVGEGGVERAGALVVGEERDPLPRPHRVLEVAVQLLVQARECAVALAVDPQLARGAAPVALPPGGLAAHRRGEEDRGVLAAGDVAHPAVRKGRRRSAVERDRTGPAAAEVGLPVGGGHQDLAVGGPAADLGACTAPVRQAPGGSAVHRGDVHLGGAVAGGGPGDGGAVR